MSEQDHADRLNKQWDDLVRTPQAARPGTTRTGDPASDTVHKLHAMDDAARPDAEFRNELRQRLLREAAFSLGQHHAAERIAAIGGASRPVASSRRWIDSLAYVVITGLLVLVTAAIVWGSICEPIDRMTSPRRPKSPLRRQSTNCPLLLRQPHLWLPRQAIPCRRRPRLHRSRHHDRRRNWKQRRNRPPSLQRRGRPCHRLPAIAQSTLLVTFS